MLPKARCTGKSDESKGVEKFMLCHYYGTIEGKKDEFKGVEKFKLCKYYCTMQRRAYAAQIATDGKLMLWGAKINSLIDEGELWRLVTSSFLHANIGHLLVNCYSLNSVGPTVEKISGPGRFLTVYFTSAIASSTLSYYLCKAPAVGASGAVFGLVGSFAMFVLRHRDLVWGAKEDLQQIAHVLALNLVIGLLSKGIDNWGHQEMQAWKCSSHNEEHSKKSTSPQTWEDLPHLKREGSAELLQRLLSLGRWISMGEEDWEQLLDGNIVGNNCEPSASNCTSGGAELASEPKDVRREKTPMWKRLACIEEIFINELDVVDLQDLGNDYLESLLASL